MREVYVVDDDRLLLVATDRVSAFDVVMAEPIPYKGAVLTQITAWWLRQLERDVTHHMLSADVDEIVDAIPALADHRDVARRTRDALSSHRGVSDRVRDPRLSLRLGVEGVRASRERSPASRCRPDLRESERLDPPLFSPATKAESGHDENITVARVAETLGPDVARELERLSRLVYERGRDDRRGARHHHRRYEVRVRPRSRGHDHADRRGAHARQLALLAGRSVPAGPLAAELRQAAAARLSRRRASRRPLEWRRAAAAACRTRSSQATSARYLDAFRRITGTELDLTELS